MGRPKGSKNKSTIMKEQGTVKTPAKKIIKNNSTKKHIQELNVKRGRPPMIKHVLKLNDWLYITCDAHCWKIVEVNDKKNPTTGEKYPDKSLLYAGTFNDIVHIAVDYMVRVPVDIVELSKKIDEVHKLIDNRIPKNTKPRDLFEEYQIVEEDCD